MQDIILYAILTLIVGGLLYSVLGKDIGVNPKDKIHQDRKKGTDMNDVLDNFLNNPEGEKPKDKRPPAQPVFIGPAAEGLAAIAAADPGFSLPHFLDGAKGAYGLILEAFAEGDKDTLATLLNDEVKERYFAAIDDLAAKGLTQETDLARLIKAEVVSAEKQGKLGIIRVSYFAELATALRDKEGQVVQGDPDMLTRVREIWSYERMLNDKNPNWRLAGVEPHTSDSADKDAPDHSPDI